MGILPTPAPSKSQSFMIRCKDCNVPIVAPTEKKMWDVYEKHRSDNHKRLSNHG